MLNEYAYMLTKCIYRYICLDLFSLWGRIINEYKLLELNKFRAWMFISIGVDLIKKINYI